MSTSISAKIVEDSVSTHGVRLTTLQLTYPRFIHAEFMTHRVFSRNASSSRAIPVAKSIEFLKSRVASPVHWGLNRPGMQAHQELDATTKEEALQTWLDAAASATDFARKLLALGVHKQVANRILEPFIEISVIVTATEWSNFFSLRAHQDAQPEIQELAICIRRAMDQSVPQLVSDDPVSATGWHLPFISQAERDGRAPPELLAKLSAARCARVSYLTHDGLPPSMEKDLALYDRLVGSTPLHASPIEHQARPLGPEVWSRNFRGWAQFREMVERSMIALRR